MDVSKIKSQFPVFKKNPKLSFFDSAASSLKHKKSVKLMSDYLLYNGSNVHRGVYQLAHESTELYENARLKVAEFIKADQSEIIFTKSTTHALNMLSYGIEDLVSEGDEIIVSELEHHSNLLPWLRLALKKNLKVKFIPLEDGLITLPNFKKVLSNKTKLVITNHISNVLGYMAPIKEMAKLAHRVGAYIIVDAAQSIAHVKIDVKKLDVDFLAFSGHKMYGPNGIGVLYGKYELLEKLNPAEYGGEMIDKVSLESKNTYKRPPYKFEAGTPPIAEAIGLVGAIEFIEKIGQKKSYQHELELRNYILEKLENVEGITIYNKKYPSTLVTLNIDGVHPHDVASFLDQHSIAVRAGHHCNQLTMKYLNVNSTIRASVGIYNTKEDCDKLVHALIETRNFFMNF
ncbi:aminotransferase class V-fold PLP-dependent enzyme [Acholeplasma equifetale]|uniref:aminotransferase class V-fold PLP-dependent enzyme n=1 Tax=Acholeplasma equifetale TaxID=264634 RepID=UPI00138AD72A|nr:cysteine desulfurase [Acholeplasma equifetale]